MSIFYILVCCKSFICSSLIAILNLSNFLFWIQFYQIVETFSKAYNRNSGIFVFNSCVYVCIRGKNLRIMYSVSKCYLYIRIRHWHIHYTYQWISKRKWNWKRLKLREIDADLHSIRSCMDWRMKLEREIDRHTYTHALSLSHTLRICMQAIRKYMLDTEEKQKHCLTFHSIRIHMVCVRDGSSFCTYAFFF